jgi:hypothetical protein
VHGLKPCVQVRDRLSDPLVVHSAPLTRGKPAGGTIGRSIWVAGFPSLGRMRFPSCGASQDCEPTFRISWKSVTIASAACSESSEPANSATEPSSGRREWRRVSPRGSGGKRWGLTQFASSLTRNVEDGERSTCPRCRRCAATDVWEKITAPHRFLVDDLRYA